MDRESDRIKQGGLAVAGFASAIKHAWSNPGSPEKLKENPQMRVIGVREPGGEEERALKKLADDTADRKVNLIALPFDENRDELFEEIGRANISLMLSWHEGFGLTGWEAIAGEVPLIVSRQTGLWQLLKETFGERIARSYVRTIDIRGQEGNCTQKCQALCHLPKRLIPRLLRQISPRYLNWRGQKSSLRRALKCPIACCSERKAAWSGSITSGGRCATRLSDGPLNATNR
jgi:hypothetical protein